MYASYCAVKGPHIGLRGITQTLDLRLRSDDVKVRWIISVMFSFMFAFRKGGGVCLCDPHSTKSKSFLRLAQFLSIRIIQIYIIVTASCQQVNKSLPNANKSILVFLYNSERICRSLSSLNSQFNIFPLEPFYSFTY